MPDKRSRWYNLLDAGDTTLRQGDILPQFEYQCPAAYVWPLRKVSDGDAPELAIVAQEVVVLTPCCDLDQSNSKKKIDFILLCPLWGFEKAANEPATGVKPTHKHDIEKGAMPRYCFLAASDLRECPMTLQVADFNRIFPIPRAVVDDYLKRRKTPRLRMNPPYREYLARSFANCYTRIGLPVSPTAVLADSAPLPSVEASLVPSSPEATRSPLPRK
jgi:hypothetical protein